MTLTEDVGESQFKLARPFVFAVCVQRCAPEALLASLYKGAVPDNLTCDSIIDFCSKIVSLFDRLVLGYRERRFSC